tara:strand:- start:1237 stop:1503 length:267 start_codon:yes stop_codon:yes gene_type:complete
MSFEEEDVKRFLDIILLLFEDEAETGKTKVLILLVLLREGMLFITTRLFVLLFVLTVLVSGVKRAVVILKQVRRSRELVIYLRREGRV